MKYYKALKDGYDYFTGNALIQNELLTEKERNTKFRYIQDDYFKPIDVSKKRTYFSFGCRFEMKL